jgi:PAS domain S-box-containing protein
VVLTELTAALRQSAAIVEASDLAIISKDLDGTILTWNRAAVDLFGYRAEEVIGQNVRLLIPQDFQADEVGILEKVRKGGHIRHYEAVRLKKDGSELMVSLTISPMRDASGNVVGASKIARDITERKQAEEKLRKSEAGARLALEASKAGAWSWDVANNVSTWDERYQVMYGFEPKEPASYEAWMARVHPEDRQRLQARIGTFLEPGTDNAWNVEFRALHPVKGERWMAAIGRLERDPSGRAVRFAGLNLDITERKRAEKRVQMFSQEIIAAREQERKQVSSVLHHDVGSLAVGISAHLDVIEEHIRSGKPGEALKLMRRTRKLVDESVARLKKLAVELRPPELDVLGLCAALRQHFAQVTERGGTRIHFRETLGRRRVPGNTATILFRVAQEALTNALKHGRAKQVNVDLRTSKEEVTLTVHDNGRGFDMSRPRPRATSQIGLRVMQEMAASAGGTFMIDSGRGKGTTVRVRLPIADRGLRNADWQKSRNRMSPPK